MKNHLYQINLFIHSINIHVSFPCTVGASLLIDTQEWEITDNIDIKKAQLTINASTQAQSMLLFNPRTSAYSLKKAAINFFLKTKSGKLQAGSTTIFLNKSLQGCTKQTAPISKCSDREATVIYTMSMELLEETETNMTGSQFKGSQISQCNTSLLKSSSVSYTRRFMNENVKLYESIVQQVDDEKTEKGWQKDKGSPDNGWDKNSVGSKGNSISKSFISDLKHVNSNKGLSQGWRTTNEFRKSRLETSVVGQNKKSTVYINSASYQNRLSASRANISQQMQDTKIVLQKKVAELQKQNKQLRDMMSGIKQKFQEQIFIQKASLKKSQILQTSLRQELQMMKHKFSSLQIEANKMLFEKNEILNKYTTKESENIMQIKAKEKTLSLQNKKLSDKVQRIEKQLLEQQDKTKCLQTKLKEQQAQNSKKLKQYEFYQQQAMQLDEKLSQLRHTEQQLKTQIQSLREQMAKRQSQHEKEFQKFKKQYSSIKQVKQQETKGLSKEMTSLKTSLKDKETELNTIKRQSEAEKRKMNSQIASIQAEKDKLQKEIKRVAVQRDSDSKTIAKQQQTIKILQQKLKNSQMQMQNLVQNRDQCLGELQARLQELNMQQFRLNENNFELQEKLAITQKSIICKDNLIYTLEVQVNKLKQSIDQKDIELSRVLEQLEQYRQSSECSESSVVSLKNELSRKQAQVKQQEKKLAQLREECSELQKHNLEISSEYQQKAAQDRDQIITLNQTMAQLSGQLHKANSQLQSIKRQSTISSNDIIKANNELANAKRQIMRLKSTNQSLEQQLQENQTSLINSNATISQLTDQIQELKQQLQQLHQTTSQHHQYTTTIDQCIQAFEQLFSSILSKDYQTLISPKKPVSNRYSTINTNNTKSHTNNSSIHSSNSAHTNNHTNNSSIHSNNIANHNRSHSQNITNSKINMTKLTQIKLPLAQTLSTKLQLLESFLITTNQTQLQNKKQLHNRLNELEQLKTDTQNKTQSINQLQSHLQQLQQQLQQLNSQLAQSNQSQQKTHQSITNYTHKIHQHQNTIERYKSIMDELRKQIANKNKQIITIKSTLNKTQQNLKQTQNIYRQSKDKMELQVNLQVNQLKAQIIQLEKLLNIQKEQNRRKQTKITELQSFTQNLKTENVKSQNQTKKQIIELKKQLTQTRKQTEKKTSQITKITNQLAELNKKIQSLTASNKEQTQKYQKLNLQLLAKNKLVTESQNLVKDKTQQLNKSLAKTKELQQQSLKLKKQKQQTSKSLISQQQINSKNLITIKEQKQLMQKKDQLLKDTQKQLKLLEGQLFNNKRLKTQPLTSEQSDSSMTSSVYSYRKVESKKEENFSPVVSTFSYNPNNTSNANYYKKLYGQNTPTADQANNQQFNMDIKTLKEQLTLKDKTISELQDKVASTSKINSSKLIPFTKTTSILAEQLMKQRILQNLQAIESILSTSQSNTRIDKYRMELSGLINKNKKIILDASPFDQMRRLNMLMQKAKTLIQNKLKLQIEPKSILLQEFTKMQAIVDEVMGK